MDHRRRRTGGGGSGGLFVCFGVAGVAEEEEVDESFVGSSCTTSSTAGVSKAEDADDGSTKRRHHRRVFSKIVRSVFFVSSLDRVGKARKDRMKYLERIISDASEHGKSLPSISRSTDEEERRPDRVFSSSSSSSSSTSSSSSSSSYISSSPPSTEPEPKPKPRLKRATVETKTPVVESGNYGHATGLWLLIPSLFLMVFFGRVCAIVWTSTCLYLVPRRSHDVRAPASDDIKPEGRPTKGYDEYEKKRVVLEGLLERNKRVCK